MSDLLNDKTPIRARHIRPGHGEAMEVKAGQFLQIQTVQGKQVADFVAFRQGEPDEFLSTAATRSTNASIIPQLGMTLYSNRRKPLFEFVEDTVGRHDMLFACCDPVRYEMLGAEPGHASCRMALTDALSGYGVGFDRIPDPINWFMNVSIQKRGELEVREPLAEPGDYVLLRAIEDVVVAVSACPQDFGLTNAGNPTDLVVRVYRDAPLPGAPGTEVVAPSEQEGVAESSDGAGPEETAPPTGGESPVASAQPPTEPPALEPASAAGGGAARGRPARLRDTAEATVVRIESGEA